jgi:hypothetical protein
MEGQRLGKDSDAGKDRLAKRLESKSKDEEKGREEKGERCRRSSHKESPSLSYCSALLFPLFAVTRRNGGRTMQVFAVVTRIHDI